MAKYTTEVTKRLCFLLDRSSLGIGKRKQGKVRDIYDIDKYLLIVTSDRVSAFDRNLASIPCKGQVLNQVSAWWFEKTKDIIPNHIVSVPDPNVIICKKCKVFPIEFVVRGYITGTTNTSMWTNYKKGVRNYCGIQLPEGLKQNQKLEKNLVTPTTKEEEHDRLISPQEIVAEGMMTQEDWDACSKKALELFARGQEESLKRGLLLVDTKYELGKDLNTGEITLVDEIHTPDSSRYWLANSYQEKFEKGEDPDRIDKDVLRVWYSKNTDPYKDKVLPSPPTDLVVTLSQRYIQLYELITGETFQFPSLSVPLSDRILKNVLNSSQIKESPFNGIVHKVFVLVEKKKKEGESGWEQEVAEFQATMKNSGISWDEIYVNAGEGEAAVSQLKKYESGTTAKYKSVVVALQSFSSLSSVISGSSFPCIQISQQSHPNVLTVTDVKSCVASLQKIFAMF